MADKHETPDEHIGGVLRPSAPQVGRSTNWQSKGTRPEVWLKIVHAPKPSQNPNSDAGGKAYLDQTVEISLGPIEAYKSVSVGEVTRRLSVERVVTAVPARRRKSRQPRQPQAAGVIELLHKAIEWKALLESGEISSQAAIALLEGISRARVTQVMGLLGLAPEIQEHLLSQKDRVHRPAISERVLRPIAQLESAAEQRARFEALTEQVQ